MGIEQRKRSFGGNVHRVLILVLMEWGLSLVQTASTLNVEQCLNPCSNGMGIELVLSLDGTSIKLS